jgi:glycine dehydrogenase subunit 2
MHEEKTIYEKSRRGRIGYSFDIKQVEDMTAHDFLPEELIRKVKPKLPEVSELDVVRHYTRLSQQNYSIDSHFYPLGSCTMKYNPRVNEEIASYDGFVHTHPLQYQYTIQGNLRLMYELGEMLKSITGLDAVSLQPAAGAHGELTGLLMIREFHKSQGKARKKVIIPDSAHGTNPSSAHIAGYEVVTVKTDSDGYVDFNELEKLVDDEVACLMITNPSTLGIFEKNIKRIANLIHQNGGLVYCDGANLNAIMGKVNFSQLGIDCVHVNLHKTFTTPHGGGGPGSGPVLVRAVLEPFLPVPVINKLDDGKYEAEFHRANTIGRIRAFYGNFGMFVRAYSYIKELGSQGIKEVSERAVLNANYIRARLKDHYHLAFEASSMHEVVFTDKHFKPYGIKTLDVAKRLLDYGFHSPTVYFPITVSGAIMIEPTESESMETLDHFCDVMIKICDEAKTDPEMVKKAPHNTFRRRLDETKAIKEPKLRERFNHD